MLSRFAKDAREVVVAAQREARELGAESVEAEHLLLALTGSPGSAQRALAAFGLDRQGVLAALELEWTRSLAAAGVSGAPPFRSTGAGADGHLPFSPSAKLALERALQHAVVRKDRRICTGHVLLGLVQARVGTVPRAFEAANVDTDELQAQIEAELDYPPVGSE
jgi:D-alanyl-D-alanine carboxypeptidase